MADLSPDQIAAIIQQVSEGLKIVNYTRYISLSGYILFLWDGLLNLSDEIDLIWSAPWSLVKFLYYFIKVTALWGLTITAYELAGYRPPMTDTFCRVMVILSPIVQISSMAACDWLMILRLVALYSGNKVVIYSLYGLFLVSEGLVYAFTGVSVTVLYKTMHFDPIGNLCQSTVMYPGMAAIFAAPFALDLAILATTSYKAYQSARIIRQTSDAPLLFILFRDGLIYYFCMFAVRLWVIAIWAALPIEYLYMGLYMLWSAVATLTLRLFLNLRRGAIRSSHTTQRTTMLGDAVTVDDIWKTRRLTSVSKRTGELTHFETYDLHLRTHARYDGFAA